ncbi:NADH:ubiquinone oxidoreductase, ESSS subunit [Ceraceosorus bombacis]|uniref:NADH dehydrogenase [ubiquinone] 1 beta subcomplex subunit 11, mitochondrial n=1 Tax=Ceraceosorus bombacis TaxID=401625 RepID=A0A0N7L9C6_9BASI|nr:NADH:ubiquinone oxidoreductase, ESSS subunit [Ceraceosorus bombacis]
MSMTARVSRIGRSRASGLAQLSQRRLASGGGAYNEPSGHFLGQKPLRKGEKREKEGWEGIYTYGLFGGMAFCAIGLLYKPDTNIQSWARAEAQKQLESEGGVYKYEPSPYAGHPDNK